MEDVSMDRAEIKTLFSNNLGTSGSGLSFMSYYHARQTASAEQLAGIFPRAEQFERQYLEDRAYNAGARVADDCFCHGCGDRGHRRLCPRCART
jgi:hypothetical protein